MKKSSAPSLQEQKNKKPSSTSGKMKKSSAPSLQEQGK
jgi:hypothetical protein